MEKINYPALFANFSDREKDLRRIIRYHIYRPMYYRSNLFTHSKRVLWLLQSLLPLAEKVFGNTFDCTKAQLMAATHDDPEIVMGDIMAGHKDKMNTEQLNTIAQQTKQAIEKISKRFPSSVLGYNYADLLHEEHAQATLESKLVKYADKFDAFGEALHEVHAGNQAFTTNSVHEELGIIDLPVVTYLKWFSTFLNKNPEFKIFFSYQNPLFSIPNFNLEVAVNKDKPHSQESLLKPSGYAPYDAWKKIILATGDAEEMENLYIPKEPV